jgi:Protein of unknown function (DUF1592)/Protein of unknown function (DUF1588)/Protein of unknown function (DUF1595)/Protein of unknown function (DUF1587)
MISVTRKLGWFGALGLAACGRLSANATGPTTGAGGGASIESSSDCTAAESLAPARIMLLTDAQYVNAVRDVFGVEVGPEVAVAAYKRGDYGFNASELTQVSSVMVDAYFKAALQVASKLQPCAADAAPDNCIEQFLRSKLPLAWRRPVGDDEIAGIVTLFHQGWQISPERAIEVTMEAVLASGSFLYRTEIGKNAATAAGSIALTSHELASAVSFAFLDSVPDAELRSKADDGSLLDPAVLNAEADRLLAIPAVRDNLKKKVSYYLNLEKVPFVTKDMTAFPQYTYSLGVGLYQGAQMFLDDVFSRGKFQDLFTSHRLYVNEEVARVYGIAGVMGSNLVPVDFSTDERGAGILTQPAFLLSTNIHAGTDDVVHRGLYIYNDFACGEPLGAPPANESAVFPTIVGTTSERWRQVEKLPLCKPCHERFDPFGLATEVYDPIGRFRSTDPDTRRPIDTTAVIQGLGPDLDGPVKNINDVAARFAAGRRASDCFAVHLVSYTVDHGPIDDHSCALQQLKDELSQRGSFPDFFKAVVTSRAFLTRNVDAK